MNAMESHWWLVNIGSGNGGVTYGTKPLPEPMLTKILDDILPNCIPWLELVIPPEELEALQTPAQVFVESDRTQVAAWREENKLVILGWSFFFHNLIFI